MNKKRVLAIMLACFMLIGIASAGWIIHIRGATISGMVTSSPDDLVYITNQFQDLGVLDVTNSSMIVNRTSTVMNNNGDLQFYIDLQVNKTDVEDLCTDYENDINVSFYYEGSEIFDNDIITVRSGPNNIITAEYFISRSSCPQNITTSFDLLEV